MIKKINKTRFIHTAVVCFLLAFSACKAPSLVEREVDLKDLPQNFTNTSSTDTTNTALIQWKEYFTDSYLTTLIDSALVNNQELNIMLQEIAISKAEIKAKKGEYLPFVGFGAAA